MLIFDDSALPDRIDNIEIVNRVGRREITHVFHDVDGTHSLIRDWPPVMGLTLLTVIENGLPKGFDSDECVRRLIKLVGAKSSAETDRFCVESAGLSALTQMEWAIRCAVEEGTIPPEALDMDEYAMAVNSRIIREIWDGKELFDDIREPAKFKHYLKENTPKLFRVYEKVLNGACRDRNIAIALNNPESMRVKGSLEFMEHLRDLGAKNYFVTGAVIDFDKDGKPCGGMYDEVCAVGFEIGAGKTAEAIYGSTWDEKIPKDKVMEGICEREGIDPSSVLVVGDGRSEIASGVKMGAVTISRLTPSAVRSRELHRELSVNIIVSDYKSGNFLNLFSSNL